MLSIIIPTLNEEKYLPLALASIAQQDFKDYEIILADGGSTDATLAIAPKFQCRVVKGGTPAEGRNNGAKTAMGELLFFLDADTLLPSRFFNRALSEFSSRNLGLASFCLKPDPPQKLARLFIDLFYNNVIILLEAILPHAAVGILVKKEIFQELGGYDETIKLAEDHDLARRAAKITRFGIIRSTEIFTSTRRSKTDGWIITVVKFMLCELHMIFIGPVRSDIFRYRFNHYHKLKK